jgi:glutamyl-tRNA reductase
LFPVVVGLNYRTAPVEVREKVSVHHSQIVKTLKKLKNSPAIEGVVLLSTCNRLEIYASTKDLEVGIQTIKDFLQNQAQDTEQKILDYLYVYTMYQAIQHLFKVASGLDSMVLGESEILGQVARAYELSCEADVNNKMTNVMFQKALAVGKRVRTETGIDHYSTSISYIAVELAKQVVGDFEDKKIVILGAGEMSTLTMKHLVAHGALTIAVSNRSLDRAKILADECGGQAVLLKDVDAYLAKADLVFSATASKGFIITSEKLQELMKTRANQPMLLIDIAVPRDIEPSVGNIEGVTLYDIDDLRDVADRHKNARELAAKKAEKILNQEISNFKKWHNSHVVLPTIAALQRHAQELKEEQLEQTLGKLGNISPKQEKIIRSMANSLVNKLLHLPIINLKEVADSPHGSQYAEMLQYLFALEVEDNSKKEQAVH